MRRWLLPSILALAMPRSGAAQETQPPAASTVTLSLADAISIALANNPQYRQALNNEGPARWAVKNAYGNLIPSFGVSGGMDYVGTGQTNLGQGFVRPNSAVIGSSWGAGFQWQIDGGILTAPSQQKANQRATGEEISAQDISLRADVTTQYLTVLAATAQVAVARQQVARNQEFLDLANARYRVGQGTLIDVRQAEVQKSQSDVELLRRIQQEREAKLELFRRMGIVPPAELDVIALTETFPVTAPDLTLDNLITMAAAENPSLKALEARRDAASAGVKAAKSQFLPTLSARAGWGGFTQQETDETFLLGVSTAAAQAGASSCLFHDSVSVLYGGVPSPQVCYIGAGLDATGATLQSAVQQRILDANNQFPFDFRSQPFGASFTISWPIFTPFGRELQVSQAQALRSNADENVRAQGLQVRAQVHGRYLGWKTAYEAIAVQEVSREAARDQLRLAQDRYRLGAGSALEVADAQNNVQRAEGDYVNAVYAYHVAFIALEAAVGRYLR